MGRRFGRSGGANADPTFAPRLATPDDRSGDGVLALKARTDRQAFAPLYRRYVDPLYRFCFHRLGARGETEDTTAQVFSRPIDAVPDFRGSSFRA